MKRRLTIRVTILTAFLVLVSVASGIYIYRAESQTTTSCSTCNEEYYTCRLNIPQCVEQKIQYCRSHGGDETSCENARTQFEAECGASCYQTFEYCWAFCSPGTNPPPPNFPNESCPNYIGGFDITEDGKVFGTVLVPPGHINALVTIYIDETPNNTVSVGSAIASEPTNNPDSFGFSWQIPETFRDGFEHTIYVYVESWCPPQTVYIPFQGSPSEFYLE